LREVDNLGIAVLPGLIQFGPYIASGTYLDVLRCGMAFGL